jgi:hypothetical protein
MDDKHRLNLRHMCVWTSKFLFVYLFVSLILGTFKVLSVSLCFVYLCLFVGKFDEIKLLFHVFKNLLL